MIRRTMLRRMLPAVLAVLLISGCSNSTIASGAKSDSPSAETGKQEYAMAADGFDAENEENPDNSADGAETKNAAESVQKLVYTCSVSMDTKQYQETKAAIKKRISEDGGIIASESETNNDTYWYEDYDSSGLMEWSIVVRIPPDRYQPFLDALQSGETSKVMSISSYVENISAQYHDKETEIKALETEEARLLEMMDRAGTIDEMIQVEQRLTEVQTRLNQSRTDLSVMDADVNYSTVTINLNEVRAYHEMEDPAEKETFGKRLVATVKESWNRFTNGAESFLFWLILNLPWLVIFGLIAFLVIRIVRRRDRTRVKKKVEKPYPTYPIQYGYQTNKRQMEAEKPQPTEAPAESSELQKETAPEQTAEPETDQKQKVEP